MNHSRANGALTLRHLYLDEAGIGDIKHERYTIVAGVLMHVDGQYDMLVNYLCDLVADLICPLEELPPNFYLSAKDIYQGHKYFADKVAWPLAKRLELLAYLAEIPEKFELPVFCAYVDRSEYMPSDFSSMTQKEMRVAKSKANENCHTISFLYCISRANMWVGKYVANEKVFLVVENHQEHRSILTNITDLFSDPLARKVLEGDPKKYMPLDKIVDSPSFVQKSLKSPVQIADICAFVFSRKLAGDPHISAFYNKIEQSLGFPFSSSFFPKKSPL